MSGRGKEGKEAPSAIGRYSGILIQGITKPAIRRLAHYGVKQISGFTYEETRGLLKVENIIRDAVTYREHAKRKTTFYHHGCYLRYEASRLYPVWIWWFAIHCTTFHKLYNFI